MMEEIRKHMRQLTRMAQAYSAKTMQGSDLSAAQMQALRVVCFHRGISQQGLACHMGIDKAAVARMIAALEGKGYLARSADPEDGRVKRLAATAEGEALKEALIAGETDFYAYALKGVDAETVALFGRVLAEACGRARTLRQAGYRPLLEKGDGPSCV